MMKAFILLTIALCAVGTFAQQTCDQSHYDSVRTCYSQFLNNYNLSLGANYTLPRYTALASNRGRDEMGFNNLNMAKVCMIQNTFSNCIGPDNVCIDPTDLPQIFGVFANDHYAYTEDFFIANYECQTAYNITMNNFYCLASIGRSGYNAIMQCEAQLEADINNNHDVCAAENTYTQCLMNIYISYCGKDAGSYICNIQNVGLTHILPQCTQNVTTCPPYSS
uniref:DUF19 domain-containing protein n=1 Tax=Rhabditophanes sp. KR3021 TaxID=114890 RepID=A0AC35TJC0_9BILA